MKIHRHPRAIPAFSRVRGWPAWMVALALSAGTAMAGGLDATMQPMTRTTAPAAVAGVPCPSTPDKDDACAWTSVEPPARAAPEYPAVPESAPSTLLDEGVVSRTLDDVAHAPSIGSATATILRPGR